MATCHCAFPATIAAVVLLPLLVTGAPVLPASASAVNLKPDLDVSAVSQPPGALSEGASFVVADTTRNKGKREAASSVTRYYLSQDPKASLEARKTSKANPRTSLTDILLVGSRKVPALKPGKSSKSPAAGVQVQIPVGVAAGKYFLLACADDLGTVKESAEAPNCKASTQGRPVGQANPTARVNAFSDTKPDLRPEIEALIPQALQGMGCGGEEVALKKLALSQARASAKSYLTATAGADAMAAFEASPAFDSADAAQEAAAEAAVERLPGAALAALLRAHELEPNEASHLINAGGLAASIGRPNEALAFLDAARTRSPGVRAPMGISRQAVALTSRGYALMQLGRNADASAALTAAIAIEPLMTEAQATLAGVKACQGQNPIQPFRKGRRRVDPPPELDESLGKVTELRNVPLSATPQNAFGEAAFYRGLLDGAGSQLSAWSARDRQIRAELAAEDRELITKLRALDIQERVAKVADRPDLVSLHNQIQAQIRAAENQWVPLFGRGPDPGKFTGFLQDANAACDRSPDPNCQTLKIRERCIPAARLVHAGWLNAMTDAFEKSQQWLRIYSRRVSGIAAHLGNPREYEVAVGSIEFREIHLFLALGNNANVWSAQLEFYVGDGQVPYCVQSPDPPAFVGPTTPEPPAGPGPCSGAVKDFNLVVEFGRVKLKVSCEEFSAEGAGGASWISGFGEVKYKGGTMTVFAGVKGEVGLGPVSGDFKSGVYVKVGNDGFRDVGWRVGPSYTVGAGPAEFEPSDMIDMSFVGAFGSTPF